MTASKLLEKLNSIGIDAKPIEDTGPIEFKNLKGVYECSVNSIFRDQEPWVNSGEPKDMYKMHLIIERTIDGDEAEGRHLFKQYNNFVFGTTELQQVGKVTTKEGKPTKTSVERLLDDLVTAGIGLDTDTGELTDIYEIADEVLVEYTLETGKAPVYVRCWESSYNGKKKQQVKVIPKPVEEYEQDTIEELEV